MIVTINKDIFSDSKNIPGLNDLLSFFNKGRHRMNLNKSEDFKAFENSDWKKSLKRSDIDFLKEGFGRIDKKEIVISSSINDFNLKEAYYFLDQSLKIILEQIEYEKPFILKIIKEYEKTKSILPSTSYFDFNN